MHRIAARQRIVSRFVGAGATSADRAIRFVPGDAAVRRVFRDLHRHGAIVEAMPGHYWLDAGRMETFRSAMRRRIVAIVAASGFAATVAAIVAAFALAE